MILRAVVKAKRKNLKVLEFDEVITEEEHFTLLLRAFKDDGGAFQTPSAFSNPFGDMFETTLTYEVELIRPFKKKMPVIAIGRPKEELPHIGANRLYVEDQYWQDRVSKLVEKAVFVLIRPSNTDGLRWEIEHCLNHGHHHKLIISSKIGNRDGKAIRKARYNTFRKRFYEVSNIDLPEYQSGVRYIGFDADKNPIEYRRGKDIVPLNNIQKTS